MAALCALGLLAALMGAPQAQAQGTGGSACLDAGSDTFDGTALGDEWTVEREDAELYDVAGGRLSLQTGPGEIQSENGNAGAPNVVLQSAPGGRFTATTKVSIAQTTAGQQAGLLIAGGEGTQDFIKATFVRKESGGRWIEFLKAVDGSLAVTGNFNTGIIPNVPNEVWIRVTSNGETVTAAYSTDGTTFTAFGETLTLEGIDDPRVGVYALRGGAANPVVTAAFDSFELSTPSDEFDGTELSECRWDVLRPNAAGLSVGGGQLTLRTLQGELSNDQSSVQNVLLQEAGEGNWQATTRVTIDHTAEGQQAGIVVRGDDSNHSKIVFVQKDNAGGRWVEFLRTTDGGTDFEGTWNSGLRTDYPDTIWLRLISADGDLAGYWSPDGETWTKIGENRSTEGIEDPQVGLMALKGNDAAKAEVDARFDFFRLGAGTIEDDGGEEPPPPPVGDFFDTVGIATSANRTRGQINGNPSAYSYAAERMPPSRSVGVPPDDEFDQVPVRMPDTTGLVPNLASFQGQVYELPEAQQGAYSRIHLYGASTDGGPAGGDFVLTYSDGTTETVTVRFPDWVNRPAQPNMHIAISTVRYNFAGQQGDTEFHIYHAPVDIAAANRGKTLVSVQLPPDATPKGPATESYLMAMTLQTADGRFVAPSLDGVLEFPNDAAAPTSTATVAPGEPDGENGWYTGPVSLQLAAQDAGQEPSGLERIDYRIDGGAWTAYTEGEPVVIDQQGAHTVEYSAIDRAFNAETARSIAINIDSVDPEVTAELARELPEGGQWYDRPVGLTLESFDGRGSGVRLMEYSIDGGAWTPYSGPVSFGQTGAFSVAYRGTDVAGNLFVATEPMMVRVDGDAPTTSVQLNGAAPVGNYAGNVSVTLSGADGSGSGVAASEYRVDGGAWTAYSGAFAVTGAGTHTVSYRSVDAARNTEAAKQVAFTINAGQQPGGGGGGTGGGGADPAPEPEPWANVGKPRKTDRSIRRLGRGGMRVPIRCTSVERGTLRLTVSATVARQLGLRSRTIASRSVRCDEEARTTVTLKASRQVRRALSRGLGKIVVDLKVRLSGEDGNARDTTRFKLRVGRGR